MASPANDIVIGIDLGTKTSAVAVCKEGTPTIIRNERGEYTEPSVVAFTPNERLVGSRAFDQAGSNPGNTIFEVKRFIGKMMDDPAIQRYVKELAFTVIGDSNGKPLIRVELCGEERTFYPEHISAMLLTKLKRQAEKYCGTEITKAVITVPAAYNDGQRQAVIDAGRMAGLEVLRIINEPTAAALTYAQANLEMSSKGRRVLVFDLGGGTFDVSVLVMKNDGFQVERSLGDVFLGGIDFDFRLMEYVLANDDQSAIRQDPRFFWRLRSKCEEVKKTLSIENECSIEMENTNISITISRSKFEQLCDDLFKQAIQVTLQCLHEAKMESCDIDDVVLVGGSTRIPKVRKLLAETFGANKICKSVNPDEAVALGAAIQASQFMAASPSITLRDSLPYSLGVRIQHDATSFILYRGDKVPIEDEKLYETTRTNQDAVKILVYEGESQKASENVFLDEFEISVPPGPAHEEKILVTYRVDENNILTVTARTKKDNASKTVERRRKFFDDDEVFNFRQMEDEIEDQNKRYARRLELRAQIETRAYPPGGPQNEHIINWLNSNENADEDALENKLKELELGCETTATENV